MSAIFEMEYEGIKFYFIDNEEHFGGSTPYAGMPWDLEKFRLLQTKQRFPFYRPSASARTSSTATTGRPVSFRFTCTSRFQADEFYRGIKTVMTIHNLKFQGIWDRKTIQSITGPFRLLLHTG